MSGYRWITNLRYPVSTTDQAYLDKLSDYKIGKPQIAKGRTTALSPDQLAALDIVGVYTTEAAIRRPNPDKITQQRARAALGEDYEVLTGPLAGLLDTAKHFAADG